MKSRPTIPSQKLPPPARPLSADAQLCDRQQAAELLGISYSSVRNLERRGKLKGRKLNDAQSSRWMFQVTDVLALAQVNKVSRLLPDLGSVIVLNGVTYRRVDADEMVST
ncbi:helix-turn-helix domain-containing protein [Bradyrhizobium sp. CCBAU 11434]|uniref:helix-turn-helix domain-containing protein n=1 Tax=Bradyrhizobium sp. CCBAU 11434 TaxID=1630885 RepID=UPI00230503C7|nr:helix-turn-helix domain-containing protein [Bradyrhizobium sp. CCBAU 11434]